jgi:hypothetical protein
MPRRFISSWAPIPAVRGTTMEPRGSTLSRLHDRHQSIVGPARKGDLLICPRSRYFEIAIRSSAELDPAAPCDWGASGFGFIPLMQIAAEARSNFIAARMRETEDFG